MEIGTENGNTSTKAIQISLQWKGGVNGKTARRRKMQSGRWMQYADPQTVLHETRKTTAEPNSKQLTYQPSLLTSAFFDSLAVAYTSEEPKGKFQLGSQNKPPNGWRFKE